MLRYFRWVQYHLSLRLSRYFHLVRQIRWLPWFPSGPVLLYLWLRLPQLVLLYPWTPWIRSALLLRLLPYLLSVLQFLSLPLLRWIRSALQNPWHRLIPWHPWPRSSRWRRMVRMLLQSPWLRLNPSVHRFRSLRMVRLDPGRPGILSFRLRRLLPWALRSHLLPWARMIRQYRLLPSIQGLRLCRLPQLVRYHPLPRLRQARFLFVKTLMILMKQEVSRLFGMLWELLEMVSLVVIHFVSLQFEKRES